MVAPMLSLLPLLLVSVGLYSVPVFTSADACYRDVLVSEGGTMPIKTEDARYTGAEEIETTVYVKPFEGFQGVGLLVQEDSGTQHSAWFSITPGDQCLPQAAEWGEMKMKVKIYANGINFWLRYGGCGKGCWKRFLHYYQSLRNLRSLSVTGYGHSEWKLTTLDDSCDIKSLSEFERTIPTACLQPPPQVTPSTTMATTNHPPTTPFPNNTTATSTTTPSTATATSTTTPPTARATSPTTPSTATSPTTPPTATSTSTTAPPTATATSTATLPTIKRANKGNGTSGNANVVVVVVAWVVGMVGMVMTVLVSVIVVWRMCQQGSAPSHTPQPGQPSRHSHVSITNSLYEPFGNNEDGAATAGHRGSLHGSINSLYEPFTNPDNKQ